MPREAHFDVKVPVMLTHAQADWLDDWRWKNRFAGRSEAIRALIDRERDGGSSDPAQAQLERADDQPPPDIKPFTLDAYPGQPFAPKIVPYLIRTARRSYTQEEIVIECGRTFATLAQGQLKSMTITMQSCGFKPCSKRLPGQDRVEGFEAI